MSQDGKLAALRLVQFVGGIDDGMRGGFGIGLGIETAEGEAQGAGGFSRADAHGLQRRRGMQRSGVAGGTGGAGDARLVKQDEHARGIDSGQAE